MTALRKKNLMVPKEKTRRDLEHLWNLAHDPQAPQWHDWAVQELATEYERRRFYSRFVVTALWIIVVVIVLGVAYCLVAFENVFPAIIMSAMASPVLVMTAITFGVHHVKGKPRVAEAHQMWTQAAASRPAPQAAPPTQAAPPHLPQ